MSETTRKPFHGKCRECATVFVVCYVPIPLDAAARLMLAAACPACASKNIVVAGDASA